MYTLVYTIGMTKTITLKALRPGLPKVADSVERKLDRYIVTRRGQPVMMVISPEDYEGLLETIEILSDKTAAKRIRRSWKEARLPAESICRREPGSIGGRANQWQASDICYDSVTFSY